MLATYHQLFERLEHLPGVSAAGAVTSLPLSEMFAWGPITVEGKVLSPSENFINADRYGGRDITFLQAMEIPPLARAPISSSQDTGHEALGS